MDRNFEQEAQKQGWKPKEEFVASGGEEAAWVDAKVFVERGESSAPILKSKLEKSERRLAQMEATVESLTKHHNRMLSREAEERKRLMSELEDAKAQAVADGDAKKFKQAEQQINKLKAVEEIRPESVVPPNFDPEIESWLEENHWYNEDPALQAMADGYAEKIKARNPRLAGRELLDKVSEFVKNHVEKQKPKAPPKEKMSDEEDRTPTTERVVKPKTGKKTFSDLPKDAQRECKRLMKELPNFTESQYLEYYDWDE